MKKTFYPLSIRFMVLLLATLLVTGTCFYILIVIGVHILQDFQTKYLTGIILLIIALLYGIVFLCFETIAKAYNRVVFLEDKILITGELKRKYEQVQFKDKIGYDSIQNVRLIQAATNSRNRRISRGIGAKGAPMIRYFEFILNDGTTKRMWVDNFSRSQRKKMLEIINGQTNLNLSYDKLDRIDNYTYKRAKK